jgi:hypothetical protein
MDARIGARRAIHDALRAIGSRPLHATHIHRNFVSVFSARDSQTSQDSRIRRIVAQSIDACMVHGPVTLNSGSYYENAPVRSTTVGKSQ